MFRTFYVKLLNEANGIRQCLAATPKLEELIHKVAQPTCWASKADPLRSHKILSVELRGCRIWLRFAYKPETAYSFNYLKICYGI